MSLKPEGCYVRGMSFDSCQLYWRHWIIKTNDTVVSDINGEAVIGQVAILICVRRVLLCTFTYKPFVVSTVSPFTSRGERVCLWKLLRFLSFTRIHRGFLYISPWQVCLLNRYLLKSFPTIYSIFICRLTDPKGTPFEVKVAKFPLLLPDYIFWLIPAPSWLITVCLLVRYQTYFFCLLG